MKLFCVLYWNKIFPYSSHNSGLVIESHRLLFIYLIWEHLWQHHYMQLKSCFALSEILLTWLVWTSLPKGDQKGRTSKKPTPRFSLLSNNLHTERRLWAGRGEMWRYFVNMSAALCDCGRAVAGVQRCGSGASGFDFQELISCCWYIHGQNHICISEALSCQALQLGRPAVFSGVSLCRVCHPNVVIIPDSQFFSIRRCAALYQTVRW